MEGGVHCSFLHEFLLSIGVKFVPLQVISANPI